MDAGALCRERELLPGRGWVSGLEGALFEGPEAMLGVRVSTCHCQLAREQELGAILPEPSALSEGARVTIQPLLEVLPPPRPDHLVGKASFPNYP